MNLQQATKRSAQLRNVGKKITLATGVFDILHQEHITFLRAAKQLTGVLFVGIESDVRVRQIKGPSRPIYNQSQRRKNLENQHIADYIFVLPEDFSKPDDHRQLIKQLMPTYLAVSSHTKHLEKKRKILRNFGGDVKVVHQHNPTVSTSLIINPSTNHETT